MACTHLTPWTHKQSNIVPVLKDWSKFVLLFAGIHRNFMNFLLIIPRDFYWGLIICTEELQWSGTKHPQCSLLQVYCNVPAVSMISLGKDDTSQNGKHSFTYTYYYLNSFFFLCFKWVLLILLFQIIHNGDFWFFTPGWKQIVCSECHNLVCHYLHLKEHVTEIASHVHYKFKRSHPTFLPPVKGTACSQKGSTC